LHTRIAATLVVAWAITGCSVVIDGKLDDKDPGTDAGMGDDGGPDPDGGSDGGGETCRDADCDDGEPCNGVEACGDDDVCAPGTPLEVDAACTTDTIDDGVCRVSGDALRCAAVGCGDGEVSSGEECDDENDVDGDGCDGDCTFSCTANGDCDDALACNGVETCDTEAHVCVAGTPIECTPADACRTSVCDEEADGCVETLIDEDGDGFASAELGECGTDCDDERADVYPDAPEGCGEARDWDCDGTATSGNAIWYPDCDGDGFAASGVGGTSACPAPAPQAGCMAWTLTPPTTPATSDCNDMNATMFPGQTAYQTSAHPAIPSGASTDDARYGSYDCNGVANYQYSTSSSFVGQSSTGSCTPVWDSRGFLRCSGDRGWTSATAPACGATSTWTECPSEPTKCSGSTSTMCLFHTLLCAGPSSRTTDPCYCPPRTTCTPDCTPGSRGCAWGYYRCGARTNESRRMGCR
jgi:hypothetical protein